MSNTEASIDIEQEDRWRGWENAEQYDAYTRSHAVYPWLNDHLVRFARVPDAHAVVDLACGTGRTTHRLLATLGARAEVVGIDASAEMVEVACANTPDPRARFVVAPADGVAGVVSAVDAVVCNAAFWQFPDPLRTLGSVADVLAPGGVFAFNVPAARCRPVGPESPFQIALSRVLHREAGVPRLPSARSFPLQRLCAEAARVGLAPLEIEEMRWTGPQSDLVELMRIPAMVHPLTDGGLPLRTAFEAVEEDGRAVDPDRVVSVDWVFVRGVRRSA